MLTPAQLQTLERHGLVVGFHDQGGEVVCNIRTRPNPDAPAMGSRILATGRGPNDAAAFDAARADRATRDADEIAKAEKAFQVASSDYDAAKELWAGLNSDASGAERREASATMVDAQRAADRAARRVAEVKAAALTL